MPIKKEREYRALAAPLTAQAAAKRIDTEYYVEGYATTFDKPYLLYEFVLQNIHVSAKMRAYIFLYILPRGIKN